MVKSHRLIHQFTGRCIKVPTVMPAILNDLISAKPKSLRANLLLLVIIAFTPILLFGIAMVILSARNERHVFERGAIERTRALITAVDAELKSSISTLEALATSYGGTGIGLAIVRKAMQRMNGGIGVESELGRGSRFWLVLNGEDHGG